MVNRVPALYYFEYQSIYILLTQSLVMSFYTIGKWVAELQRRNGNDTENLCILTCRGIGKQGYQCQGMSNNDDRVL